MTFISKLTYFFLDSFSIIPALFRLQADGVEAEAPWEEAGVAGEVRWDVVLGVVEGVLGGEGDSRACKR